MARPDKAQTVAELGERFSRASATVLTEYRGLSVKDLKQLRRSLGEDASYTIAKNTLTQLAAHQAGIDGLDQYLTGPTAITFIDGDIAKVAKGLRDFAREHPALVLKAGLMDGNVLDAQAVKKLADLESREVLLSKMAAALKGGASLAVRLLAAPLAQAARALDALRAAAEDDPTRLAGVAATADQAIAEAPAAEAEAAPEAAPAAPDSPVAETATEAAPEAETAADATAQAVIEADAASPTAEAVNDTAAETVSDTAAQAVDDTAAEAVSDTAAEAVSDTAAQAVSDTAAQAVTEEAAQAATEADTATTSAAQAATEEKE
jgi:large subunit ribosomal protein L10